MGLGSLFKRNKKGIKSLPTSPSDTWAPSQANGGAYEARSHTHALKALKFEEVEHTICFHLTTHLTTMHVLEGASSF